MMLPNSCTGVLENQDDCKTGTKIMEKEPLPEVKQSSTECMEGVFCSVTERLVVKESLETGIHSQDFETKDGSLSKEMNSGATNTQVVKGGVTSVRDGATFLSLEEVAPGLKVIMPQDILQKPINQLEMSVQADAAESKGLQQTMEDACVVPFDAFVERHGKLRAMSLPPSPTPSSGSDDFAALIDAELQSISSDAHSHSSNHTEEAAIDAQESERELFANGEEGGMYVYEGAEEGSDKENLSGDTSRKRKHKEVDAEYVRRIKESEASSSDQMGFHFREREDSKQHLVEKGSCPPHPGYMWGVCIRCGALKPPSEPDQGGVALRYIHEELELSEKEAARMRQDELQQVLAKKKLYLVIDLDHTMLNSARFVEVPPEESSYLTSVYPTFVDITKDLSNKPATSGTVSLQSGEEASSNNSGLYKVGHLQMWTKLRPFAHRFLGEASKMFEMYVYTMGERVYALAMAQLLDPKGRFFGNRVISQGDSTRRNVKDLDIVLGAESAVVILDDTEWVWPKHKANLILMERYHFFSSSSATASLLQARQDESEEDGVLSNILDVLRSVHNAFFSRAPPDCKGRTKRSLEDRDVRKVVQNRRLQILAGCKVVFSRIFPTAMTCPQNHTFWRLTEELGAVCTTILDSSVTHVVALDRGTDKARWALQQRRYLVHPRWVEAALYTWKRPREEDFPVVDKQTNTLFPMFSKTISVKSPNKECIDPLDGATKPVVPSQPLPEQLEGEHSVSEVLRQS